MSEDERIINDNSLDECKINELYQNLGIDCRETLSVEMLAKEYKNQMNAVKIECYETVAYLYR